MGKSKIDGRKTRSFCVTDTEAKMFRSLYDTGESIPCIARTCNRSMETVHRWLNKTGSIRPAGETHRIQMSRGQMRKPPKHRIWSLDESTFDRPLTPETAWALGNIFADGNVRPKGRLLIACGPDKDIAENHMRILHSEQPIKYIRNCWMAEVSSIKIVGSLKKMGVTPSKTFSMQVPNIPESLQPHFIRGAWEGDGCLCTPKKGSTQASYTSASKLFVEGIAELILKNTGLLSNIYTCFSKKSQSNSYVISYRGKNATALCTWLYTDSKASFRCLRKYSKASSIGMVLP